MKFWEENGRASGRGSVGSTHSAIHLENPESHLRWYFKYFLGTAHQNYYGKTAEKNMFILSVVKSDEHYRAILWAKTGLQRIYLPVNLQKTRSPQSICQEFGDINVVRAPREIKEAEIQRDLLYIEEQEGAINFKFGVLYRKKGQSTDNEILCNNDITPSFEKFLNLIGEKVALKGFNEYRGGLDVKGDTTGTHTYRTVMEGKHIMFHVANMLPFSKDNPQQVERKRHIGNDIVNIVFQEEDDEFDPTCFLSQMSHIYASVTYRTEQDAYLLRVFNEEAVPPYGPEISGEYTDHDHFRRVLLVKLMNGEKAVYETPQFVARRERTIDQLLREIYKRYVRCDEQGELDHHLRPFADLTDRIIETTPRIGRKKRFKKAARFTEKGQDLKFQKIISGHAPTSKNCTSLSLQRKLAHFSNWRCDRVLGDIPQKIHCADFWDTFVVMGSDNGLSLINTLTADVTEIYDSLFVPKQILVVEEKSIAIVRAEKGKNKTGCIYTFDLSALTMKSQCTKNIGRKKTKQEKIQATKGCSLVCCYLTIASKLYMSVVKHKMIQLYEWIRIPGQGQGWFQCKNDFQISDVQSMCMFSRPSGLKICVGTSTEFLIIDAEAGENDKRKCIERLQKHKENTSLCITPVVKDEINNWAIGVLLTYNNISVLEQFTLHPDNIFTILIKWNVKPLHIHSSLPYFMAIGQQGIEIRMASNGNVVHSIDVTCVSYLAIRCDLIYLSTWDNSSSTGEIVSLPTSVNFGSNSTISSTGLALSNESVEHSAESPGSTLTRESPLRRSFNDHAWARTYTHTETHDDLANNIFSCLSLTDLAYTQSIRPP